MSDLILRPSEQSLEVDRLRRRCEQLESDLAGVRTEYRAAQGVIDRLRHQLAPFYEAMAGLFGDMDKVSRGDYANPGSAPSVVPGHNDHTLAIWESWKDKLGRDSACSRIIEALLHHGQMSVAQLRVACKIGQQTVYDATSKMGRLGLIDRDKSGYRLRKL